MASIPAFCTHSQFSKIKGDIIKDDKEPVSFQLFLFQPVSDSIATAVHKGCWFNQDERSSPVFYFSTEPVTTVIKNSIGCLCKGIQYHKTNVMSCIFVIRTGVTQPNDKVFHDIKFY